MLQLPETLSSRTLPLPAAISVPSPSTDARPNHGIALDPLPLDSRHITVLTQSHRAALKSFTDLPTSTSQDEETSAADDAVKIFETILAQQPTTASGVAAQLSAVIAHNDVMGDGETLLITSAELGRIATNLAALTSPASKNEARHDQHSADATSHFPAPTRRADPDLMVEIDRLVASNDVQSMIALYDLYVDTWRAIQAVKNQPRSGRVDEFLSREFEAVNSKAVLVFFYLQKMKIGEDHTREACRVIVDCAMKMGMNLDDAIAVVSKLSPKDGSSTAGSRAR